MIVAKLLGLCCFLLVVKGEVFTYNYHERVGIKLAEDIRRVESNGRSSRIVGGSEVEENPIPYQAGLIIILESGWTSVCSGALVSRSNVLTAAHCWNDGQNRGRLVTVVLGAKRLFFDGLRLVTTSVDTHPQWNIADNTFDIAMVSLPIEVEFNENIQPIALPSALVTNDLEGVTGDVSGYGTTTDSQSSIPITTTLHQTTLTVMSDEECQISFRGSRMYVPHEGRFCTRGVGGLGLCTGDGGSPLAADLEGVPTLIGIGSFRLGDSCEQGFPSVFSRVSSFVDWIQNIIDDNNDEN